MKLWNTTQEPDEPLEKQWADQLEAEWQKEAANRAALLESLLIQRDWASVRRWIDLWETEDSAVTLDGSGADLLPTTEVNER